MKFMSTTNEDAFTCEDGNQDPIYMESANSSINEEQNDASPSTSFNTEEENFLDKTRTSRQLRKVCRNTGKAYITSAGKFIPEKKMTPLSECRAKCSTRFTPEMQQAIFNDYWSLGSYDKRTEYITSMITVSNKKSFRPKSYDSDKEKYRMKTYSYVLEFEGKQIPTCKGCFLKTLDESEGMVKTVAFKIRECPTGTSLWDMRGRHSPGRREDNECIILAKSTLPFF